MQYFVSNHYTRGKHGTEQNRQKVKESHRTLLVSDKKNHKRTIAKENIIESGSFP
jgi:hypothetical protein